MLFARVLPTMPLPMMPTLLLHWLPMFSPALMVWLSPLRLPRVPCPHRRHLEAPQASHHLRQLLRRLLRRSPWPQTSRQLRRPPWPTMLNMFLYWLPLLPRPHRQHLEAPQTRRLLLSPAAVT